MWPDYHRNTEADRAERLVASSVHALVMLRWRLDYATQRLELRKREHTEEAQRLTAVWRAMLAEKLQEWP